VFEGETQDPLAAGACEDRHLERDLPRKSTVGAAADSRVLALGVLAHEEDVDVVDLALRLAELQVEATPINFLIPIPGIRLEKTASVLNPLYCLKVLALFRLANPKVELRIAGGREVHLRR
jgi:hypothetical protein